MATVEIGDPLSAAANFGGKLLDLIGRWIPDPRQQAEAAMEIMRLQQQDRQAQAEINKVEAASSSIFVAGWRPWVGWVGGIALAWNYVACPVLTWFIMLAGFQTPPLPELSEVMGTILVSLLGINIGARTVETVQGVARQRIGPLAPEARS